MVVIIVGLAAGLPLGMLSRERNATEQAFVLQSFTQQIGANVQETQIVRVTEGVYMASWINDNAIHAAWSIGGLWVEVYSQELAPPADQEPVPEE